MIKQKIHDTYFGKEPFPWMDASCYFTVAVLKKKCHANVGQCSGEGRVSPEKKYLL
jgi:hypothetical protein